MHDFLVEHLEVSSDALVTDDDGRFHVTGAVGRARTLRSLDQIGSAMDDADLNGIAEVPGSRPRTPTSGSHSKELGSDLRIPQSPSSS